MLNDELMICSIYQRTRNSVRSACFSMCTGSYNYQRVKTI